MSFLKAPSLQLEHKAMRASRPGDSATAMNNTGMSRLPPIPLLSNLGARLAASSFFLSTIEFRGDGQPVERAGGRRESDGGQERENTKAGFHDSIFREGEVLRMFVQKLQQSRFARIYFSLLNTTDDCLAFCIVS